MVLVAINIVVLIYVGIVVLGVALILSANAQRPISERGTPIVDLSSQYNAVIGNSLATIGMTAFVVALIIGAIWAYPRYSKAEHSLLAFFPGFGLGFKLVAPAVVFFFMPSLGGWALGLGLVSLFATTILVQTLLYEWSHAKGGSSPTRSQLTIVPESTLLRPDGRTDINRHSLQTQA